MSVIHIHTAQEFQEKVMKADVPVLVDFWATWCGPCKMIAPEVEAVADAYKAKAIVAKVDVDEVGAIAMQYKIQSIPTLIVIKDGKEVAREVGYLPQDALAEMLDSAM